jgi:predicted phosphoadenosine phosphosulfate sulfurtransferase
VRTQSDTVILAFSSGKDSICSWLKMLKFWKPEQIIPVHYYMVAGHPQENGYGVLPHVERALQYYEDFFGTHIIRLPHPMWYRTLRARVFQPAERLKIIGQLQIAGRFPKLDMDSITQWFKKETDNQETWEGVGIRMKDNMQRRMAVKKHGSALPSGKRFYPVWDYSVQDVRDALKASGIHMSVQYRLFGRSFGGLDARYTKTIREKAPEDWETLKAWYPLVDLDIFRYECRQMLRDSGKFPCDD